MKHTIGSFIRISIQQLAVFATISILPFWAANAEPKDSLTLASNAYRDCGIVLKCAKDEYFDNKTCKCVSKPKNKSILPE